MAEQHQLADGFNHAALLKPLARLNPPLFADYWRALPQRWRGYVGTQLTGGHTDKTWGKPSVKLTLAVLTRAEFVYLKALIGPVTLRALNEDTDTWHTYNAVLRQVTAGDFDKQGNHYVNVVASFIDLDVLS